MFSHLELIAPALAAVGILILIAGLRENRMLAAGQEDTAELTTQQAGVVGIVQGLALPFRGFSRSGSTISAGMLAGAGRRRVESFSFALAVVLTPPVILREVLRLKAAQHISTGTGMASAAGPALIGAVFAFIAGLLALRWLSGWLESGRWYIFGIYCLVASVAVWMLHMNGY